MRFTKEITFFVTLIASIFLLSLIPEKESRIARIRLGRMLELEGRLKQDIAAACTGPLGTRENSEFEKIFQRFLSPESEASGSSLPTKGPCQFTVVAKQENRFSLSSSWRFHFQLRTVNGNVLDRHYALNTLRPLCLVPLIAFLLSIAFRLSGWGLKAMLVSYVFLLSGMNLIRMLELSLKGALLCLTTDQTFLGFTLILVWLALYRQRTEHIVPKHEQSTIERVTSRLSTSFLGIWNPICFTLLAPLFVSMKGGLKRLSPFLDLQVFIATISLYVLALESQNILEGMRSSISLPRYFSFAVIIFFAMEHAFSSKGSAVSLFRLPSFLPALVAILCIEGAHHFFLVLDPFNTLTRLGVALLLSELIYPVKKPMPPVYRTLFKWLSILFVSTFVSVISLEAGATEMILVLLDPKIHPSVAILLTFFAGIALGFLTGNFPAALFPLMSFALRKPIAPTLQEAALIDGVLAGILLSPFSLYNLFVSRQAGINIAQVVRHRFHQLFAPLLIGGSIYMVGTLTSVAILQPVTFVFTCLVAFAIRLSKNRWTLSYELPVKA